MAYARLGSGKAATLDGNTFTTPTFDSSGANFLVFTVSDYGGASAGVVTDSKGNTINMLTEQNNAAFQRVRLGYIYNGTFGAGHTLTVTHAGVFYPSICWGWYSGALATDPFDDESGDTGSGTVSAGNCVPTEDNELMVSGANHGVAGTTSSLTEVQDQDYNGGVNFGSNLAEEIQTTATTRNPNSGAVEAIGAACFKFAPGGTAAVTGTATAAMTEADVVAGGKTIILTLTNDTWIPV